MTSILNEYKATEAAILELTKKLDAMRPDVQPKLEAEKELLEFVEALGLTKREAALMIFPDFEPKSATTAGTDQGVKTRRAREVKIYQNPHTGEIVETKGGNQKTLKEWKAKHGADAVESWLRK
jgi:hypothetical protein